MHDRPGIWLRIFTILTSLGIAAAAPGKPPIPISYATTRITGPLTTNGLVDYVAAFNQRFGKGVTPENNAAVPLLILFRPGSFRGGSYKMVAGKMTYLPDKNWGRKFREALGITAHELTGPRFVDFQNFRKHADPAAVSQAAGDIGHLSPAPPNIRGKLYTHPWSAHNHPWAAAWLQVNEGALDVARSALRRRHFFIPLLASSIDGPSMASAIGTVLGPMASLKALANAFSMRAMLELHKHRLKACMDDLLAIHQLAQLTTHEPFLIFDLVADSVSTESCHADEAMINSGRLSSNQLRKYMDRLSRLPSAVPIFSALDTGERWLELDTMQRAAASGNVEAFTGFGSPVPKQAIGWTPSQFGKAMKALNAIEDQLISVFKAKTYIQKQRAFLKSIANWQHLPDTADKTIILQAQMCGRTIPLHARNIATFRMDRLALALAAYRSDHGIFPDRLAQLSPKYLRAIPRDPFTGKPFQYSTGPAGCTIASPGKFPPGLSGLQGQRSGHALIVHLRLTQGHEK